MNQKAKADLSTYLDAREILRQFQTGEAPECLPTGEFKARHFGTKLDCDTLEEYFEKHGVRFKHIEVLKIKGTADFAYVLERGEPKVQH
ncbi:MAG: hypothetical protein V7772_06210 [Pseudomonas profundi]|uniref:hypothetical protein n=1 Tax=Pseudomonas profundi TaxID=1981513 RepID=UPI00300236A3